MTGNALPDSGKSTPVGFEPTRGKGPFREQKIARRHSESASTRTIPAEGRARIVKSPQFLNIDHADLRRGSRAQIRNRQMSSVFDIDHADLRRGSQSRAMTATPPPRLNKMILIAEPFLVLSFARVKYLPYESQT